MRERREPERNSTFLRVSLPTPPGEDTAAVAAAAAKRNEKQKYRERVEGRGARGTTDGRGRAEGRKARKTRNI